VRIAVLTSFPEDAAAPVGGVESVSVNLVGALARIDGLEVHMVTTRPKCRRSRQQCWQGATVHYLPWEDRRVLSHVRGSGRARLRRYLEELNPDVIHAHDFYGIMVRQMPYPRVFTPHGFIYEDTRLGGGVGAWLRSRIWRRIELAGWADQPHIIAISPYVSRHLADVATGVIHEIDNPVAKTFFDIKRIEPRRTIFCAARISRLKNTLGLVEAFAKLAEAGCDAQLRLAGGADRDCRSLVQERIRQHGIEDRVIWLGSLTRQQIQDELASAGLFALVSLQENAPMGVAEAMAAGVPVVTSNRCGMPYMVEDNRSGLLVDPTDPDDIAAKMQRILDDDALSLAMGQRARQIACDRFDPDAVAARTVSVYYEAIETARARP